MATRRNQHRIAGGGTAMASEDPTRVLSIVALPLPSKKAIEIAIVFEQREKVAKLLQRLEREYRSSAVQLAHDIAGEAVETFNFVNFVGKWKPVSDRVEQIRSVLGSFLLTLDHLIASYENEHAEEVLQVLEKKRDELEMTLKEQNIETGEITRRIDDIQRKISDIQKKLPTLPTATQSTATPAQSRERPPTSGSKT
jgi:hypothetical protein